MRSGGVAAANRSTVARPARAATSRSDMKVIVPPRDLDTLIDSRTNLLAVFSVSMATGYQHDLKAVCDLAHTRGALVYGDAVQAVGAVPVNVCESGIDFVIY